MKKITADYLQKEYGGKIAAEAIIQMNLKPVGTRVLDSEGNPFVITGFFKDGVSMRGRGGEKEISIHDLKFYHP